MEVVEIIQKVLYILQPYNGIGVHKKCSCLNHAAIASYYPINYYISYHMFTSRYTRRLA